MIWNWKIVIHLLLFSILSFLIGVVSTVIYLNGDIGLSKSDGTLIANIVLAFATLILVLITRNYAKSTKEILDEQTKSRKKASIEKILEKVYNPMNNAFNEFRLENDNLPEDKIPLGYDESFIKLYNTLNKIDKEYHHLFDQDIIQHVSEIWRYWKQYQYKKQTSSEPEIEIYKVLICESVAY